MKSREKKSPTEAIKDNLKIIFLMVTQWIKECVTFLLILFKPWNLILIAMSIAVIYYSQTQTGTNRLIFEIISAFLSSFTGGIITYYFLEFLGNSSLVKKSVGAIRNLQLIKYKVTNISDRISELISTNNDRDFDEIDNLVQNVHKDIINSIGDWSDVNPTSEAITDYYEMVAQKEIAIKTLTNEKKELEKQKNNLAEGKTSEINKLSKDIEKKDEEIGKLREQLSDFNTQNIGIMSGSAVFSPSVSPSASLSPSPSLSEFFNPVHVCKKCNRTYTPNTYLLDNGYCENCRGDVGIR